MKFLLSFIISLSTVLSIGAQSKQDFVELLINTIKEDYAETNIPDNEYKCITVSPNMIGKVLQMIQNSEKKDKEQINKLLPYVKSLRIFSATNHINHYYEETQKLLDKYKTTYKPYRANSNEKMTPCIWLRKNRTKVIEIIMLSRQEDNFFQVVNLTGDMTKDFVTNLLKM